MNIETIRVVIVEDDKRLRENLIILIENTEGFRCVGAYESAEKILTDFTNKDADIVLMDINLPKMNGIECVSHLKKIKPNVEIMMLTVYEDTENIFASLEAGATGYLSKGASSLEIVNAIKDLSNGGSPMSSQIARKVVQVFNESQIKKQQFNLTEREKEILDLLVEGKRYKEIAKQLFISDGTVHAHLHKIYEKLQVKSRYEAVIKYFNKQT